MKVCPICGEEFEPEPAYRKYCCISCADIAYKRYGRKYANKKYWANREKYLEYYKKRYREKKALKSKEVH